MVDVPLAFMATKKCREPYAILHFILSTQRPDLAENDTYQLPQLAADGNENGGKGGEV
jgi:hypothetical protein